MEETTRVAPFSLPINLNPKQLNVLRASIRSIKATDEVSRPIIEGLTVREAEGLLESDVVMTIVKAELPANLAAFALELLEREFDLVARRDWHQQENARQQAQFYANNETYGLF